VPKDFRQPSCGQGRVRPSTAKSFDEVLREVLMLLGGSWLEVGLVEVDIFVLTVCGFWGIYIIY
jgi:hypothetical protein